MLFRSYGVTLAQLVSNLVGQENGAHGATSSHSEGVDYISMFLSALVGSNKRAGGFLDRLLRGHVSDKGHSDSRQPQKAAKGTGSSHGRIIS